MHKPPNELYIKGRIEHDFEKTVAIVGTRKPSEYGKRMAVMLTEGLVEAGFEVVSGLALGIDSIAHRTALKRNGRTHAVLAGGVDRITPTAHTDLAKEIIYRGGMVLSEFPDGDRANLGQFLARNRIIAAMSRAVIVVEAAVRSGTLSTARNALELGREVLSVPGQADSICSEGTNQLIRNGATLIRNVDDILESLGIADPDPQPQLFLDIGTPEELLIVDVLRKSGPSSINDLVAQTNLSVNIVMSNITMLEIKGVLRAEGGEVYMR